MRKYVAADIGGTFIKCSLMDENSQMLSSDSYPTAQNPDDLQKQLIHIVKVYQKDHDIQGVALSTPGFLDTESGDNTDYSVREYLKCNFKKEMERRLKIEVSVENDTNCAAIGEMKSGAAKGVQNFCLLTIGTGIGGAIVIDGRLYKGKHNKAGEAGLAMIGFSPSGQGIVGEGAAATSSLVRSVSEKVGKEVDGEYIFANLSDPDVAPVYQQWIANLAMVVGNMAMILDPELILIGGGISRQCVFIEDLKKNVAALFPEAAGDMNIAACQTGNHAGKIGALHLLLQRTGIE